MRKGLGSLYEALNDHPGVRDLHGRISEHPTFAAVAREPEEGCTVLLEPLLEESSLGEDSVERFAGLARKMEPTSRQLRNARTICRSHSCVGIGCPFSGI